MAVFVKSRSERDAAGVDVNHRQFVQRHVLWVSLYLLGSQDRHRYVSATLTCSASRVHYLRFVFLLGCVSIMTETMDRVRMFAFYRSI